MNVDRERIRLLKKLAALWTEDNAMYPADIDGVTTIPTNKMLAWSEALTEFAAVALLKCRRRDMPVSSVPVTVRMMTANGLKAMREAMP